MSKKIYVGNLPYTASEEDVRQLFEQHGDVFSVSLITDRETGRPRGFGFIEMDEQAAGSAIETLNGMDLGGRSLTVNEARPRAERSGGYGGGRDSHRDDRRGSFSHGPDGRACSGGEKIYPKTRTDHSRSCPIGPRSWGGGPNSQPRKPRGRPGA